MHSLLRTNATIKKKIAVAHTCTQKETCKTLMAEKFLHKNRRLQAKDCLCVPLGTPDREQLSVQCLLLPIGGETYGRSLSSDSYALPDV